jgi:hypothetical protein
VYPKVSGQSHNKINNNKHSLRSNTEGYGGKTHQADSQNIDTDITAPIGRELYHLQFFAPGGQSGKFWIHPRTFIVPWLLLPALLVA